MPAQKLQRPKQALNLAKGKKKNPKQLSSFLRRIIRDLFFFFQPNSRTIRYADLLQLRTNPQYLRNS